MKVLRASIVRCLVTSIARDRENRIMRTIKTMLWVVMVVVICFVTGCADDQKYGQGDPPDDYIAMFGNGNGSRLDFVQNQTINKLGNALAELSERVKVLEIVDPNAFVPHTHLAVSISDPEDTLIVNWGGSPGIANPDEYYMNSGYLVEYNMGFRSDGVVVWQMRPAKEVSE